MATKQNSEAFCSACGSKPHFRLDLERLDKPGIPGTLYMCDDCWWSSVTHWSNRPELVYMGRNT